MVLRFSPNKTASNTATDTTNFNDLLASSETTVQLALEKINSTALRNNADDTTSGVLTMAGLIQNETTLNKTLNSITQTLNSGPVDSAQTHALMIMDHD